LIRQEHHTLTGVQSSPSVLEERLTASWRPVILDARSRADRAIVEQLKRREATTVLDQVAHQRSELGRLVPPVDKELLDEPPRSVYYPWRKSLVRMVGPRG